MQSKQEFCPNWTSAPGDTIADILLERGLSKVEFARLLGSSAEKTSDLLEGRLPITIGIARRLEHVIGGSVEFWISRDFQYRQDSSRLDRADEGWLSELPIGDMVRFGWIKPPPRPSDEMQACLQFFGVENVQAWRQMITNLSEMVAFRTSTTFESRPAAVAAWLRQGELVGEAVKCEAWNPVHFERALSLVRALTREKKPDVFVPKLSDLCASAGVAVAIIRAPNGCRASGATRFLSSKKALLQLSFRYLSDDHFWFTFFHEAGHLLLHGDKRLFLEGAETPRTKEEDEANQFAERMLVPGELRPAMLALPLSSRAVLRFARKLGVSPGIVVGQLQHYKRIGRNQLNGLKRRFKWGD